MDNFNNMFMKEEGIDSAMNQEQTIQSNNENEKKWLRKAIQVKRRITIPPPPPPPTFPPPTHPHASLMTDRNAPEMKTAMLTITNNLSGPWNETFNLPPLSYN